MAAPMVSILTERNISNLVLIGGQHFDTEDYIDLYLKKTESFLIFFWCIFSAAITFLVVTKYVVRSVHLRGQRS
jgi:hypothetical protein